VAPESGRGLRAPKSQCPTRSSRTWGILPSARTPRAPSR